MLHKLIAYISIQCVNTFLFERTSYAPLAGLAMLAVLPSAHYQRYIPIVTGDIIDKVLKAQYGIVVSAWGIYSGTNARTCRTATRKANRRTCTQLLILGLAFMSVSVDVSGFFDNLARRILTTKGAFFHHSLHCTSSHVTVHPLTRQWAATCDAHFLVKRRSYVFHFERQCHSVRNVSTWARAWHSPITDSVHLCT
jgi:hypothetical protein